MEKFIVYDADWQTPARTEQYVYECLKNADVVLSSVVYIAFPWANLFDGLARETLLGERLLVEFEKIKLQIKNVTATKIVTTCQHIKFSNYSRYFKELGVTDLFVSHKEKDQTNLGSINLYPLQLFPVQASSEVKESLNMGKANRAPDDRKFLYSFVGAYDGRYYLTDSRKNIFQHLRGKDGLITERTSWHYQARVYDQQVYGKELSLEYLSEEQKNALEYIEVLQNSLFSLCPSGTGPNSIRLWESIEYGAIPVILADTLDLPGDPALWLEACVVIDESESSIKEIPKLLTSIRENKKELFKKLEALSKLRETLGIDNFVQHILDTIAFKKSVEGSNKKIVIDCSNLDLNSQEQWVRFLANIREVCNHKFEIEVVKETDSTKSVNLYKGMQREVAPEFSQDFAIVFDSKTITHSLLNNFESVFVFPNTPPHNINHQLLPLLQKNFENYTDLVGWRPKCSLITSMFNGDDYKRDFLSNIADFDDLPNIEFMVFRPESRGHEHFDLVEFGKQHTSLVYYWVANDPGLYDIWNLGTSLASSKYLSNANIDDKRGPLHITALVNALESNKDCDVGSTALRVTDTKNLKWEESEHEMVWYMPKSPESYSVDKIAKFNNQTGVFQAHNIPHCMPVWRAKLHRKSGFFEEKRYGPSSDWEFWLRSGSQGSKFYLFNEAYGLYYRAPTSYWRRDPNAKNYDLIIANEYFDGESKRQHPLSRNIKFLNFERLLRMFKAGDYCAGLAHLFKFVQTFGSDLTASNVRLLEKICQIYLNVKFDEIVSAQAKLKPVSTTKDIFFDSIGFYLRNLLQLDKTLLSKLLQMADKVISSESELLGWIIKAKLYSLSCQNKYEKACLSIAYEKSNYDFWANVNRIYGLESPLSYFVELLGPDSGVPSMSNFSWVTKGQRLFYLPDYSHGNPYQNLLYKYIENADVTAVGLSEKDSVKLDVTQFKKGDVLHIHWINVLFRGRTSTSLPIFLDEFLAKLKIIKSNGVKIVWTVHNRQNHESVDQQIELNFRNKLSQLSDVVLLHHPMIASEIKHWLHPDSHIEIVEHGLYDDYYPNDVTMADARIKLGIQDKGKVVSTLGLIREYKNLPEKIKAIKQINRMSDKKLTYQVAGRISCEATKELIKQADEELLVENRFIDDSEVQLYANASDYILLSYRDILTSGSFFQAVTFDCPVLAPMLGSLNYYVCDGINGYKYEINELNSVLCGLADRSETVTLGHKILKSINWPDFKSK